MPRAMWTGAVALGLINAPVKMFPATKEKRISFNMLNGKTGARIKQKRVDADTGDEVPYENIVSGFPIGDSYVTFDEAELNAVAPAKTRQIALERFADASEINPLALGKPYYLAPADGGANAYELLVRAMEKTGKVGIGRVVLRTKESLAILSARDGTLVCQLMLFADEVLPSGEFATLAGKTSVSDRELEIAERLVAALSSPLDHEAFKDEHRERLLAAIERKGAGIVAAEEESAETPASPPDLMAALEASLMAAQKVAE